MGEVFNGMEGVCDLEDTALVAKGVTRHYNTAEEPNNNGV